MIADIDVILHFL